MESLPEWAVYGVPALIWIVALINWLKDSFNMEAKWTFPVATALGAIIGTALYFSDVYPAVKVVTTIAMGAILIGLAAGGYYSGVKNHIERSRQ